MYQQDHHDYYISRANASRDLAQRASDPAVAAIHAEFAERYNLLAVAPAGSSDNDEPGIQLT